MVTLSHFITLHYEHYHSFGHDRATTLFQNASIIQDIKQKVYSHALCVSPEPILFNMFNMKSISIVFFSIQLTMISALSMYSTK